MRTNQRGNILLTTLIFMMVLSFMLVAFLDMSSNSLKQSVYAEHAKKAFYMTDGGLTYAGSVVDRIISEKSVPSNLTTLFPEIQSGYDSSMYSSLTGMVPHTHNVSSSPSFTIALGDTTVKLDVYKVSRAEFAAGSSGEFASGYEGIGGGMAAGGVYTFVQVEALGNTSLGSKSNLFGVYRKVSGIGGGT